MFAMPWMASAARGGDRVRRAGLLAAALAGAGGAGGGVLEWPGRPGRGGRPPSVGVGGVRVRVGGGGKALEFAACMRSHGVPNFPDPTVKNGSAGFSITPATGIDQSSPQYQSAGQACQSLRGGGRRTPVSAQNLAKELKFAKCMRPHGVPDFPDPNKNGGFSGSSVGINPQSPTFQNAQSTCMQLSGLGGRVLVSERP